MYSRSTKIILFAITLLVFSCHNPSTAEKTDKSTSISDDKEKLGFNVSEVQTPIKEIISTLTINSLGLTIKDNNVLKDFYSKQNYDPAWLDFAAIDDALAGILKLDEDGLNPDDYYYSTLNSLYQKFKVADKIDASEFASFDVLLTEAIIKAADHLISGKVDPILLKRRWEIAVDNYKSRFDDPAQALKDAISNKNVSAELEKLKPSHYMYTGLKEKLKEFRAIQNNGGWLPVSQGETLKPGAKGKRVLELRARLAATNDLIHPESINDSVYDQELADNVKQFQKKYGLEVDGNIGKNTLAALNMTVDERIEQIKANLERGRWVMYKIENKFIAVNIAGFELYFIDGEKELLTSEVMVGELNTQTPVFKDVMKYIDINPTWTVPTSLNHTYIDKLKNNPSYLKEKNINVVTTSGQIVEISGKDWSKYTVNNFPYMFRQEPGPGNALGDMKFMFPNKYSIYLHDTPAKCLFNRDIRAFSHGCIRTKEIYRLAELLLEPNNEGWDQEKIKKIVETRKTTTVLLKEQVPVLLLYWTAGIGFNKNFYFKPDIYGRDKDLIENLNRKSE